MEQLASKDPDAKIEMKQGGLHVIRDLLIH